MSGLKSAAQDWDASADAHKQLWPRAMLFHGAESFENQKFADDDLHGVTVADKDFYKCHFRGMKLGETKWPGCTFESCVFEDCDMTRMMPRRMGLRGVTFKRCKLMGIEWGEAQKNPELRFEACSLRYSSFVGMTLRETVFEQCIIIEANFIDSDMKQATMTECELSGTTFTNCNLIDADFSSVKGAFIDPGKNKVKGLHVPMETAVALALACGMKVAGYD